MTYAEHTIDELLARVASRDVTPAGGTVAAVAAATGASLCEMVCIHTLEKDEHADVAADMADLRDELRGHRRQLLELADADAAVIDEVFGSSDVAPDQSDLKRSITVPTTIAETCLSILEGAVEVSETGTPTALADIATGAFLVHSALRASVFTARANVGRITDDGFAEDVDRRTTELEAAAADARDRVVRTVEARTDRPQ